MKEIDASHVVVRTDIDKLGLSEDTADGIMRAICGRKTDKMAEDMYYSFATGAFWIPVDDHHPFREIVYESRQQPDLSRGVLYIEKGVMANMGHEPASAPADGSAPVYPSTVIQLVEDAVYCLPAFTTRTVNGISYDYIPVAAIGE